MTFMKLLITKSVYSFLLVFAALLPAAVFAQSFQGKVSNLRPYDKTGINVFENLKADTGAFSNLSLRIGAGFTQEFQGLKHENNADKVAANKLYGITPGFNTSMANLFLDATLADGI